MSAGAAGAAAAAAAAQMRQEEEEMTGYTSDDLGGEWEFKILRSNFATFGKPEKLREILDEEARSGWVLLEKFDDQRIRLKRPISARALDAKHELDPYRTTVSGDTAKVAMLLVGIFGAMGMIPLVFLTMRGVAAGGPAGLIAGMVLLGVCIALPIFIHTIRQQGRARTARRRDDGFDGF